MAAVDVIPWRPISYVLQCREGILQNKTNTPCTTRMLEVFVLLLIGGEYRDRTGDLLHAMQALSQLS